MFERLTDRASLTMPLANQVAGRFHYEYIQPEHVLWSLVAKDDGVAATALRNLGLDLPSLRAEIEQQINMGPDKGLRGKLLQTARARDAVERAIEEARTLGHQYAGTGHILLALLEESDGAAMRVLTNNGLKVEDIRQEVFGLWAADLGDESYGWHRSGGVPSSATEKRPSPMPYRNFPAWQKADELARQVYTVMDQSPTGGASAIVSRLCEIALSIPPYIAEAHENRVPAEKKWFFNVVLGSLRQFRYLLEFAQRLGSLKAEHCQHLDHLAEEVGKVLYAP